MSAPVTASRWILVLGVLTLLLATVGCEGDGDGDGDMGPDPIGQERDPAPPNPAYAPPADRIDPAAVASWSNAQFQQLGEQRSGIDGHQIGLPATANQRYVSATGGDDTDDGSAASPWRTLQHAADTAPPNTTIYVDDSAPYQGGLELNRDGAADAWIVFTAKDAGRPPLLTGAGLDRDAVVDISASFVVLHGFEIADHSRGGGANDPADEIGIQIEARGRDIDHVYVLNNHVHHIGPPDAATSGGSCDYNAHGIIAQSEGYRIANLIIDGNELNDLYVGSSECLVVNGLVEQFYVTNNYVHDVNNIAIDIIGYEKNDRETTSHGLIADNVVLDASNYWPYCSRGNCTYPAGDESSDGIYVDGGARLEIAYNVVGRTDHGIELQSENAQLIRDVQVHHNAVFNSNYRNFTLGPSENVTESNNRFFDEPSLDDDDLAGCK